MGLMLHNEVVKGKDEIILADIGGLERACRHNQCRLQGPKRRSFSATNKNDRGREIQMIFWSEM
jgi:hypothetical protein